MQLSGTAQSANPLQRAADRVGAQAAIFVYAVALLGAAALCLFVAFDETYDETQVFAVTVAALGVLGLATIPGRRAAAARVFTAAMLCYAGALLFYVSIGPAILIVGGAAVIAAFVINRHHRASLAPQVGAVFAAMGGITGLVLLIVLVVGG